MSLNGDRLSTVKQDIPTRHPCRARRRSLGGTTGCLHQLIKLRFLQSPILAPCIPENPERPIWLAVLPSSEHKRAATEQTSRLPETYPICPVPNSIRHLDQV